MLVAVVRDEMKRFTQERDSLTNSVTLGKDVLDVEEREEWFLEEECRWGKLFVHGLNVGLNK
jgi:hypothetical protein